MNAIVNKKRSSWSGKKIVQKFNVINIAFLLMKYWSKDNFKIDDWHSILLHMNDTYFYIICATVLCTEG